MNTKHFGLSMLAILAATSLAIAEKFEIGPGITASDLATQLKVHAASMVYKHEKPFSRLTVGLVYKERQTGGEFEEVNSLLYTTYTLPKPTTKQEIKVLVSETGSAVIVGGNTSSGKGISLPPPNALMNPPYVMKDGSHALMLQYSDPLSSSEESMKGILELVVIPLE